jgi:proteasome lid subunit RPN8/RPN11
MSEGRIKLQEQLPEELESQPMPLQQALRWVSPWEGEIPSLVRILMTQHAYMRCTAHAGSDLEHEVGGILVGQAHTDDESDRLYIIIENTISAEYTRFGPSHLTFTQDSLVYLNSELERRFPGKRMVGWYHTHPQMDVFLSSHDCWIHSHFFGEPWQVALVIEPCAKQGGFFCWQAGGELDPHHYVGFYELADLCYNSAVTWANLQPKNGERAKGNDLDEDPIDP